MGSTVSEYTDWRSMLVVVVFEHDIGSREFFYGRVE